MIGFVSVILMGISAYAIAGNIWTSFRWYVSKKRGSLIPFIGGIAGALGVFLAPIDGLRSYWWVPLIVDLGCGLLLVGLLIELVKKIVRGGN